MSTYDLFDELEDVMTLGFGMKPLMFRYSTPNTKDIAPASRWTKDGNSYSTVVRVVGINEDEVEVSVEDYGILIKGESNTFGEEYSQEVKLGIAKDVIANIESVRYEVKNGMCKVVVDLKEPAYHKIAVTKSILDAPKVEESEEEVDATDLDLDEE